MEKWIHDLISEQVAQANTRTTYRAPLVGYARADDPLFDSLQERVPGHLHPRDLLEQARTVCAFFLPFDPAVVKSNAQGETASEAWARAYVETNALLVSICEALVTGLRARGVRAAWEPPTHNFDPIRLVSAWSHKSAGYIAGLGRFGHHHMLITEAGCAGRLSSIVLGAEIAPTPRPEDTFCAYEQGCRACVRRCPVGALTENGFDRQRCYAQCLQNDALYPQWLADVCGKCASGPCAYRPAGKTTERE